MNSDKNFDGRARRFQDRIYGGMKGQLRLEGLWEDMLAHIPALQASAPLSIWDAGGGLGQMSMRCAELGHAVALNDVSADMLEIARQSVDQNASLTKQINIYNQSIQAFAEQTDQRFDVIVCHAVLEWLQDAEHVVELLCDKLKPGGVLSLAFYNINANVFMNVLKGNFNKALSGDFAGHPGSLTPPCPQHPEQVLNWLQGNKLEVISKTGVRVAFDYLRRDLREQRSDEDIIKVENFLRQQEGFWALGRYVHFIASKS
jgi:S-adenosylmethionine-dependent methyltransferase